MRFILLAGLLAATPLCLYSQTIIDRALAPQEKRQNLKDSELATKRDSLSILVYREWYKVFKKEAELQKRNSTLDDLLDQKDEGIVTARNYDTIIVTKFGTLSGTEIKNGKYIGSSFTLDSKSLTANLSIKPFRDQQLYIQPTISGTSKEGFVDIFTKNKYSRTITGGINFIQLLGPNPSDFSTKVRNRLHNELKVIRSDYATKTFSADTAKLNKNWNMLKSILDNEDWAHFIDAYYNGILTTVSTIRPDVDKLAALEKYKACVNALTKVGVLPVDYTARPVRQQRIFLYHLRSEAISNVALTSYLDTTDHLQQKVKFNSQFITWLGGGLKYNQGNYSIRDDASTDLVRGVRDEYITANLSYTVFYTFKDDIRVYFSPTIIYQNNHNYSKKGLIKGQIFSDYPIGSKTIQKVDKELSFYPKVPDRLHNTSIEFPFAIFSSKRSLGGEVVVKKSWNDVDDDNLNVKLGLLIPVNKGAKNQFLIEPLVKFYELNNKGPAFWKNHFSFGINLTLTFPDGFWK